MLEGGFFEHSVNFQSQRSVNKLCNHDTEPLKLGGPGVGNNRENTGGKQGVNNKYYLSFRRRNTAYLWQANWVDSKEGRNVKKKD